MKCQSWREVERSQRPATANIQPILFTFAVSKLERSSKSQRLATREHPPISVTFAVSKLEVERSQRFATREHTVHLLHLCSVKIGEIEGCQNWQSANIPFISVTEKCQSWRGREFSKIRIANISPYSPPLGMQSWRGRAQSKIRNIRTSPTYSPPLQCQSWRCRKRSQRFATENITLILSPLQCQGLERSRTVKYLQPLNIPLISNHLRGVEVLKTFDTFKPLEILNHLAVVVGRKSWNEASKTAVRMVVLGDAELAVQAGLP